jgi:hypothetical protein
MKVEESKYSIAELLDWYKRKELVVNTDYQRGGGLWPASAKSYFIDTILKEFPFPKVYFHERLDRETRRPRREIVDGQQRIRTIVDFVDGKFALGKNAVGFEGKTLEGLTEDQKDVFYSYTVLVDVIRNAERSDILQMFRRMNAFTLPLNSAEKRHSEFFGEFKDWVNIVLDRFDRFGSTFIDWDVLTSRQIVRMADAEFITDLVLAIEEGIVSTSPAKLAKLYKDNNIEFRDRERVDEYVSSAFEVTINDLSELQNTYITRPHIFHSFMCALLHNCFGLPDVEERTGLRPTGRFYGNREVAIAGLKRLAAAHEERDIGVLHEYVQAASEGGNRAPQRAIRIKWLCRALQGAAHLT